MPTSYGYQRDSAGIMRSTTTVACGRPGCETRATFFRGRYQPLDGHEAMAVLDDSSWVSDDSSWVSRDRHVSELRDRPVSELFRFIPGRGRYTTMCRECERDASRRSRAGAAGRRAVRSITGKFGVELELKFPARVTDDRVRDALNEAGLTVGSTIHGYWNVRGDGSIRGHGYEICSPPLQGDDGFDQLFAACRVLARLGAKTDSSCGLHVHHDVQGVSVAAIQRFVRTWSNNQDIIDGLVAPSRRNSSSYYCRRLSEAEVRQIEQMGSLDEMRSGCVRIDRYRTVNVSSYPRHGTIEVRQHQGTFNYEKIRTWILLGQAMLVDACGQAEARPRARCVTEMLDRLGALLDETAKTFAIGRAVQFGHAPVSLAPTAAAA